MLNIITTFLNNQPRSLPLPAFQTIEKEELVTILKYSTGGSKDNRRHASVVLKESGQALYYLYENKYDLVTKGEFNSLTTYPTELYLCLV